MIGKPDRAATYLTSMRNAQTVAIGDRNPIVDAILTHGDMILTAGAWDGSPTELVNELAREGAEISFLGGGKAIAHMLRESQDTLDLMGWLLMWRKSGRSTKYSLQRALGQERLIDLDDDDELLPLDPDDLTAQDFEDIDL